MENLLTEKEIHESLAQKYTKVRSKYPDCKIIHLSLVGSQNYGIEGPNSDVDALAIILPSIQNIIDKKSITDEIIMEDNSHVSVKDLKSFCTELEKGSINSFEVLNPKINPITTAEFQRLVDIKDYVFNLNPARTFNAIRGMIFNEIKRISRPGECEKNRRKCLAHIKRLEYLADALFIRKKPYDEAVVLHGDELAIVREIKFGNDDLDYDQMIRQTEGHLQCFELENDTVKYLKSCTLKTDKDILHNLIYIIYCEHISKELKNVKGAFYA